MKILHLLGDRQLPSSPDEASTSGVVRAALEIGRAQARLGHDVTVAAVGHRRWVSTWNGVQLLGLPHVPWARIAVQARALDFRVHLPYIFLTRRRPFDIVHGHLYSYLRFLRARARVAHLHSDPFDGPRLADLITTARHSDAQIAPSRFVAEELKETLDGLANVHLVYCGVDATQFDARRWHEARSLLRTEWRVPEDGVVFLYAGAFVPEKGVIHLARAFARLRGKSSGALRGRRKAARDVTLVLAGSSQLWGGEFEEHDGRSRYEQGLRELLGDSNVARCVRFLGRVPSSSMAMVYAASDVVVVPSVWREALGLVALEALASGRPVIASRVGGLVDLLDEGLGLLVPPADEPALEDAMEVLLSNPALRHELGNAGRARSLLFSWESTARELETVYRDALAARTSASWSFVLKK